MNPAPSSGGAPGRLGRDSKSSVSFKIRHVTGFRWLVDTGLHSGLVPTGPTRRYQTTRPAAGKTAVASIRCEVCDRVVRLRVTGGARGSVSIVGEQAPVAPVAGELPEDHRFHLVPGSVDDPSPPESGPEPAVEAAVESAAARLVALRRAAVWIAAGGAVSAIALAVADTDTEPSWIFNPGSAAAAAIAFSFLLLPLSALVWAVSRNAWRLLLASVLLLGGFVGTNGPDLLVNESLGRHEETVVVQGQNGDCGRYQSHGESGGVTGCFFVVDGVEGTPSEVPIRCDEDECPKKGARITIWWAPEAVGTVHLTPPPSFAWVWWLPLGIGLALNAAALVLFARSGNRAWKPRK